MLRALAREEEGDLRVARRSRRKLFDLLTQILDRTGDDGVGAAALSGTATAEGSGRHSDLGQAYLRAFAEKFLHGANVVVASQDDQLERPFVRACCLRLHVSAVLLECNTDVRPAESAGAHSSATRRPVRKPRTRLAQQINRRLAARERLERIIDAEMRWQRFVVEREDGLRQSTQTGRCFRMADRSEEHTSELQAHSFIS